MTLPTNSQPWMAQALCRETDTDGFFPDPGDSLTARAAIQTCRLCDVREQCLNYAITHGETHGVWGGMTPRERHAHSRREGRRRSCRHCGTGFAAVGAVQFCSQECRERRRIELQSANNRRLYRKRISGGRQPGCRFPPPE